MPYGNKYDFPPYLDENGDSYFVPPSFSKELLPCDHYVSPWEERSEMLGPFRIGTIPPGESVEIELKIFSTKGDWSDDVLNLTVQSLNTDTTSKIINLKAGRRETCKLWEELKR